MRAVFTLNTIGISLVAMAWLWAIVLGAEIGTPTGYLLGGVASIGVLLLIMGIAFSWYRDTCR